VFVDDQPVSVKWLFQLATGGDYHLIHGRTATRALAQIGIETKRIDRATKSASKSTRQLKGAERVAQRNGFLTRVAERIASNLPAQVNGGEIQFTPGRNYLQIFYTEFPRSYYELRLAMGFDEVTFHLEGKRDDNLARLALLVPHQQEFSAALGHTVVAEPWGANWARLAIDLPSAAWTDGQAEEYAKLMSHFMEVTYPVLRQAFAAVPGRRRSRAKKKQVPTDSPAGQAHAILDQQLAQIRAFLQGRAARPSDEVLCDWVQFCHTFELFGEANELFNLIVPSEVNEWLYGRTKRLAQVCRMRART
jgi:hypothetical protein